MAAAALLAGCGSSPSSPSDASSGTMLLGQTVSAVDGVATAGLSVQVGSARPVTTDSAGNFQTDVGGAGRYPAVVRGAGVVERETTVSAPAPGRLTLSLIPATFDLGAFDQMMRASNERLQRWTTRPALVVLGSVMSYRGGSSQTYSATSEQVPDADVTAMVAHLQEGLSLLTGGTYTTFASVDVERPASGARVSVARDGTIVVGRYTGIVTLAGTIGLGTWAEEPDGSVDGGIMLLDRDFDRDDSRRRLLRIHELGHALGYQHVTSRASIMNPSIGPEPTEFDRGAAAIAFQRPPGNRSPDVDPAVGGSAFSLGAAPAGGVRWALPVP
jgi:hypothetical protein